MNRITRTVLAVAGTVALTAAPALAQHPGGGRSSARTYRGGSSVRAGRAYSGGRVYSRGGNYTRGENYSRGNYSRGYYNRGYYTRGYYIAPVRFYRPYYTFRPRFSIGFGLWAGYPFAYSYGYYDPFAYGYAYPYPAYPYSYAPYGYSDPSYQYAPQAPAPPAYAVPPSSGGTITAQPNQANMGGLSFDITPSDAEVFVDGREAGTVGEFTATSQPLGLPAGRHRIEIRANGYQTMSFDVDIVAGQVIPYQGTLQR